MSKPPLKIWIEIPQPQLLGNVLLQFLRQYFDVTMDKDNPDFLFFTRGFYHKNTHYLCPRVFYAAQHSPASVHELSDWELAYMRPEAEPPRQTYMPNWLFLDCARLTEPPEDANHLMKEKIGFCVFLHQLIYSVRSEFYDCLSAHRRVDALGDVFRNRPRPPSLAPHTDPVRLEQLAPIYRKYKFVVSFESHSLPGYVTEKLVCTLLARSVPIYWGDPWVAHLFNPACFINAHDFASPQALVEHVLKVDADDDLYRSYLEAPIFRDGQLPACARRTHLRDRIRVLVRKSRTPQFLPQGQRSIFLREHLSRCEQIFLSQLFPYRLPEKDKQNWSDPQRFHVPAPTAPGAHRTPYAATSFA